MAHEALISFKLLLQKMENDLGLSDLSDVETKVFLAISDLCNQFETAKTQAVLQHQAGRINWTSNHIFRAMKKLEDRDKIAKSQDQYGMLTQSPTRQREADFVDSSKIFWTEFFLVNVTYLVMYTLTLGFIFPIQQIISCKKPWL